MRACYGFRLSLSSRLGQGYPATPVFLFTRKHRVCLEHFAFKLLLALVSSFLALTPEASAQTASHAVKADLPPQDEIWYGGLNQDSNGELKYLKGDARVRTSEMTISADEIEFNSDTYWATARGHVRLEHFKTGDVLNADHGEFNLQTDEGKFYAASGTSPPKLMTNPAALTTTNPFYFQALWVDRIKNRYILHHGFVTDCKIPKPWWKFEAPKFDIVPGDRAIARNTIFTLGRVPILYLPYFRRPLGRNPRQSGFLTPNFGHTTLFGFIYGLGYYWAINRSYDMTGVVQYFTQRGPAFQYDFRGKPNEFTDFNFNLYSVDDRGVPSATGVQKEGGTQFEFTGRTQILGFTGRIDYNYLSSYLFRQAFSYSFATAIQSEVNSIGYLQRRYKDDRYTLTLAMERNQLFEAITYQHQIPNQVIIQKLPSLEFSSRDQEIFKSTVPVWFSFNSSATLFTRDEPTGAVVTVGPPGGTFQTGATARADVEPRVATNFQFKNFSITPSITFGATEYSNSYTVNQTTYSPCTGTACTPTPDNTVQAGGGSLFRKDADVVVDLRLPVVERIFTPPKWLHLGAKLKHVIETDATYEYVTGIDQFQKIIHFDETDLLSNTNQLTLSVTNRLYKKDKNGAINELFTWRLEQARYFDPTFGGAVVGGAPGIGARNVVLATEELTPFTFLDGPRTYSPVVSDMSVNPYRFIYFSWRTDYDPLRGKLVANTFSVGVHVGKYFGSVSDNAITTAPVLLPQANQMIISGGYGSTNRRGWNVGGLIDYDRINSRRLYDFIQTSYNTDCCGFSIQLRQYNLGIRNDNQYLFSFSVANLGTFGSLQRQDRIF